ncbi:MAG: hypothetical protein IPL59_26880 [Candidatus Competibacteraceae bacterium]|nr:hypothetical protein [Candidatus Competibacteraceae bacterium]
MRDGPKGFAERTLLLPEKEALAEKERLHSQNGETGPSAKSKSPIRSYGLSTSRSSYMEQAEVERKKTHEQMVENQRTAVRPPAARRNARHFDRADWRPGDGAESDHH